MESKGTEEKITYPNIYFTVDNFEDVRLISNKSTKDSFVFFV
jgi:hypothetical protein